MFERFAQAARTAVEDARYEAERRGDRRIGSEHLLIALLNDGELAKVVGVDSADAHEAADRLDRAALSAIGLTLGDYSPKGRALGRHAPLMTSGGKAVLQQTLANAAAEKAREITPRHMLLALLARRAPDPAATLLAALPIDQEKLRERLAAPGILT